MTTVGPYDCLSLSIKYCIYTYIDSINMQSCTMMIENNVTEIPEQDTYSQRTCNLLNE